MWDDVLNIYQSKKWFEQMYWNMELTFDAPCTSSKVLRFLR